MEREKDPIIELYRKDVDMASIRRNLRLTHEERFLQLMRLQKLAAELQRAGKEARDREKAERATFRFGMML